MVILSNIKPNGTKNRFKETIKSPVKIHLTYVHHCVERCEGHPCVQAESSVSLANGGFPNRAVDGWLRSAGGPEKDTRFASVARGQH